ncbi:MAG TPA: NmrA family NAD(P)-binding protein [Planctomycetota bacterium]|jgi:uncharacterized protein YbjT (DUF2867 family)|nr:NmrA family NAD(P)-binding protein [Planctomycetota bacterium]
MYAVAGVSGNTGSVVADTLLSQGKALRVLVRNEAKGALWRKRGAEVAVASLDDAKASARALRGTEGAYLLLPPDFASNHVLEDRKRMTDALAAAVAESGCPHVVFLSSIGAQYPKGTGVIRSTHFAEKRLGEVQAAFTFLRAAYFMENWGAVLKPALEKGILPTGLAETRRIPMVATRDIGLTAAKSLVEPGPRRHVIELSGPAEYSPADVATTLSRIVGRTVKVAPIPEAELVPALTGMGFTPDLAELFREMHAGINAGLVAWEGRGATALRGTTTLETVLKGLVERAKKP